MFPEESNHSSFTPPLPIVWGDLTEKNVRQLQRLNSTIFPVKYSSQFYSDAIRAPDGFVKLAYYNELLIGAVCCRKERFQASKVTEDGKEQPPVPSDPSDSSSKSSLYIMTLGVLAPYRERGIGKQLLTHVLDLVHNSPSCADVVDVYLHVQEGNEDALRFYRGYDFEVKEKLVGYYKRIEPADCLIVRKIINRD